MDKLIAYSVLNFNQFSFPEIRPLVHLTREFPGATSLRSVQEAAAFLETRAQFPIFIEPIAGNAGAGSMWVDSYADGIIQLRNGKTVVLSQTLRDGSYVAGYCSKRRRTRTPRSLHGLASGLQRLASLSS